MIESDGERFWRQYDKSGVPKDTHIPQASGGGADAKRIAQLTAMEKIAANDLDAQTPGSEAQVRLKNIRAALDQAIGISQPGAGGATNAPAGGGANRPRVISIEPMGGGAVEGGGEAPAEQAPASTEALPPGPMQNKVSMPAEESAPEAKAAQTNQVQIPDEVMKSLRFGKGFQTRAEKEVLRNMVTSLPDDELLAKAKKVGLNAARGAKNKAYPEGTFQVNLPGDKTPSQVTRQQLEQEVYDAAVQKGW
jgi:uncharacterized protein (DUF4415 family)